MKVVSNKIYAEVSGVNLRYDMIFPSSAEAVPAVICIHGGGWVSGDKSDMHEVAKYFASRGLAAFCPQYRLAPLYPFPAAIEDCREFVSFLRKKKGELKIMADAIGSFGNSAGGHLSAMLAFSADQNERVNAAVDVSGLTDLTNPQSQHPPISWDFIGQFIGVPFSGAETEWIEASPLYQASKDAAPLLIFHGSDDDIVWPEQSRKLQEALQNVGATSELRILEGEGHSFSEQGFHTILNESLAFFQSQFTVPGAERAMAIEKQ